MINDKEITTEPLWKNSTIVLLITNIIIIIIAMTQKWEITYLLFVYFFQCVFIVIFYFLRIYGLKEYKLFTKKLTGKKAKSTKTMCLVFFIVLFPPPLLLGMLILGFTSIVGMILIQTINTAQIFNGLELGLNTVLICISVVILFLNHLYSYNSQKNRIKKDVHIEILIIMPIIRSIPLLVFVMTTANIIFNKSEFKPEINLLAFLIIKTILDIMMHLVEKHLILEKPKDTGSLIQ